MGNPEKKSLAVEKSVFQGEGDGTLANFKSLELLEWHNQIETTATANIRQFKKTIDLGSQIEYQKLKL